MHLSSLLAAFAPARRGGRVKETSGTAPFRRSYRRQVNGSTKKEELIMVMLSTLSPHGTLAAGTGNLLWTNIVVIAVILVAVIAAMVSLKKG
jgi:hypothetical protein